MPDLNNAEAVLIIGAVFFASGIGITVHWRPMKGQIEPPIQRVGRFAAATIGLVLMLFGGYLALPIDHQKVPVSDTTSSPSVSPVSSPTLPARLAFKSLVSGQSVDTTESVVITVDGSLGGGQEIWLLTAFGDAQYYFPQGPCVLRSPTEADCDGIGLGSQGDGIKTVRIAAVVVDAAGVQAYLRTKDAGFPAGEAPAKPLFRTDDLTLKRS